MPIDETLIWQQYLRDTGTIKEILIRGLGAAVQIQSSKRIKLETLFPHLKNIDTEPLHLKIQRNMQALAAASKAQS